MPSLTPSGGEDITRNKRRNHGVKKQPFQQSSSCLSVIQFSQKVCSRFLHQTYTFVDDKPTPVYLSDLEPTLTVQTSNALLMFIPEI